MSCLISRQINSRHHPVLICLSTIIRRTSKEIQSFSAISAGIRQVCRSLEKITKKHSKKTFCPLKRLLTIKESIKCISFSLSDSSRLPLYFVYVCFHLATENYKSIIPSSQKVNKRNTTNKKRKRKEKKKGDENLRKYKENGCPLGYYKLGAL